LTEHFDASVAAFSWSEDSKGIYFQTEEKGEMPIYWASIQQGKAVKAVVPSGYNAEFDVSKDGRMLVLTRTSFAMPSEIFAANADGTDLRQVTHENSALLAELELPAAETFWFAGAGGTKVEAFLLRLPHFDAAKKYPLLVIIHGGPQQMWSDAWSYRWNPEVMAAPGYVALMINFRGSPGYGQEFEDEVSRDWGGKPYEDIMKGVDAALEKYPFIDGTRMAAAGGSFGGDMVGWIATHTDRFKCLISHAGTWDEVSMYGATEELWFMDWEFAGPPWSHPQLYKKWSPDEFAGELGKYKTPTLVIAGEQDYRVPYTQALEFFTALQREGVPSKLMLFPNEGHWILKPADSELWYKEFLGWLAKYLK
jgi:dipeptidyl aminopeptidase/acylaminoacyl peptidase